VWVHQLVPVNFYSEDKSIQYYVRGTEGVEGVQAFPKRTRKVFRRALFYSIFQNILARLHGDEAAASATCFAVARLTETARYGVVDADAGRSTVELRLKAVVVAATSGVDELETGGTGRVVVPAETLRRRRAARAAAAAIDRQPATIYTVTDRSLFHDLHLRPVSLPLCLECYNRPQSHSREACQ